MRSVFYWLSALILSIAIAATVQPAQAAMDEATEETPQIAQQITQADFSQRSEDHFKDLGVEGSVLIYDQNQDRTYQYNPERNATPFLPASTFKILNSLISLETGVIADEIAVFTWDGIERAIPAWNRDLNMKTAFTSRQFGSIRCSLGGSGMSECSSG